MMVGTCVVHWLCVWYAAKYICEFITPVYVCLLLCTYAWYICTHICTCQRMYLCISTFTCTQNSEACRPNRLWFTRFEQSVCECVCSHAHVCANICFLYACLMHECVYTLAYTSACVCKPQHCFRRDTRMQTTYMCFCIYMHMHAYIHANTQKHTHTLLCPGAWQERRHLVCAHLGWHLLVYQEALRLSGLPPPTRCSHCPCDLCVHVYAYCTSD